MNPPATFEQETVVTVERDEVTRIEPIQGWPTIGLREVWRKRELIWVLASRDVKVRYKQSVVGVGWVVLQPLLSMLIFTVLFSRIMKVSSNGIPYPVFALCGLVPWTFFVHSITKCTISLAASQNLLTKVHFPRLTLPMGSIVGATFDLAITFGILFVLIAWYGITPTWNLLTVPLFLVLLLVTVFAGGLWLSATNVRFRDVENGLPFLMQVLLFLSPVAYPASMVPDAYRWLYALNPMTTVVSGFRYALLGEDAALHASWLVSVGVSTVLLYFGLVFFRHQEERFADVV